MKCPKCDGTGEMQICEMGFIGKDECDKCHGKGYLTNEEWFCSLPTKEKAKYFARLKKKYFWQGFNWADDEEVFGQPNTESDTRRFENWLKEKHDGSV